MPTPLITLTFLALLADPVQTTPARALFDGKSLAGWKATDFGGQGEVHIDDGAIHLDMGGDMTGITLDSPDPIPVMNYEITLEAKRVLGGDFFCGLTFPVGKDFCSLIVGGWGGGLVGLSNLDGKDASNNETSSWRDFENNRWYKIRLRVETDRIRAWIDQVKIVDAKTKDRQIATRPEVKLSRPLGFSTWRTAAALKDIQIRPLAPGEADPKEVPADDP
ncbi:DUF1080 domain-containing protein [bacterium]|nr:DUF1080 domain-containing protein [bacterium]